MARIKFHTIAAVIVLGASAAWVLTGKFSSVGSEMQASEEAQNAPATPKAGEEIASAEVALRTVAFVKPNFVDHNRTIRISGATQADKRVTLAARSSGIIGALNVRKGDYVEKDSVLLSLDGADKFATVKSAEAVLVQRQKELDAAEQLVKRGTLAKLQEDNVRSSFSMAQSQLDVAKAEIDKLLVKAPFAGIVDAVMVEQGSYLQTGADVAVLLKLDKILALGGVSESDIALISLGAPAQVRLISGEVIDGKVSHIAREASTQTRTFPVEVEIDNPDNAIPSGMTAEITLFASPVKAVVLPRSVVTLSVAGDLGVRILKLDDTVDFVPIDLVDDMPTGLVLGGIPSDSRIIVAGQDLVNEGDKVIAVEADAAMIGKLVNPDAGTAN